MSNLFAFHNILRADSISSGLGGVLWIPFIYTWGRAPVLFWSTVAGTMFTLGCALSPNFTTYYSMRALMGVTLTAGQTIGLAFIQDMFFHEHAKKIGIWTSMFIVSPYCGPLFASFIVDKTNSWRNVFWMMFGLGCALAILIILFIDESWYRRDIALDVQPPRGHRWMRVLGAKQIQNHTGYFLSIGTSCRRLAYVLFKPIIIPIMIS
jgi:MFS family permease